MVALLLTVLGFDFRLHQRHLFELQEQRLDSLEDVLRHSLQSAVSDVVAISADPGVRRYLEDGGDPDAFRDALMGIAEANISYDQVRYIDETGQEVVRLDRTADRSVAGVADHRLQDKSSRYYFVDTMQGAPGAVYVSPLDLNVENGKVDDPPKPVIRVATAVFDMSGNRRGILIINVLGAYILDTVDSYQALGGHDLEMLNGEGYYLYGGDQERRWGFMFDDGRDWTMARDEPDAWKEIRSRVTSRFDRSGIRYLSRQVRLDDLLMEVRTKPADGVTNPVGMQRVEYSYLIVVSKLAWSAVVAEYGAQLRILLGLSLPLVVLVVLSMWNRSRQALDLAEASRLQRSTASELANSRDEVKALQALLPICSNCAKIRDDNGYWHRVADYLTRHEGLRFTHGVCQDCLDKYYVDDLHDADMDPPHPG